MTIHFARGRYDTGGSLKLRRPCNSWIAIGLALAAVRFAAGIAQADEVLLANGDRVTGKVIGLAEGKLSVETPYNKALEIDWASVKSLRIDSAAAEIVLTDGTRLKGTTELSAEGGLAVSTDSAGPVTVPALNLVSQINPPQIKPVTYTGDVQAAAALTSGNSETLNANFSGKFVARSKRQRLTLRGLYHYGEDRDKLSAQEASGSVKYDFFATEKLYTYVNSLMEYNKFQDLNLRSTLGAGLGYQFLEDERKKLSLEFGVSYFNEDFRKAEDDSFASGRWAVSAEYKLIPDKIFLFHFHEGYFGFEDIKDVYLRSEQGVRFTVLKDFYTTFQVNLTYDNTPAPGFEKTDTTLLFGLGYAFDL